MVVKCRMKKSTFRAEHDWNTMDFVQQIVKTQCQCRSNRRGIRNIPYLKSQIGQNLFVNFTVPLGLPQYGTEVF